MIIKKFIMAFILCLSFAGSSQAATKDALVPAAAEPKAKSLPPVVPAEPDLKQSPSVIPEDLVVSLAFYLEKDDFHSLTRLNRGTRAAILADPLYLPKMDDALLIQFLLKTPLDQFKQAMIALGRQPKAHIGPQLKRIIEANQKHDCDLENPKDVRLLPMLFGRFSVFIKAKNVLWYIAQAGNEDLEKLHEPQRIKYMEAAFNMELIEAPVDFVRFYYQKLALLSKRFNDKYTQGLEKGYLHGDMTKEPRKATTYKQAPTNLRLLLLK